MELDDRCDIDKGLSDRCSEFQSVSALSTTKGTHTVSQLCDRQLAVYLFQDPFADSLKNAGVGKNETVI